MWMKAPGRSRRRRKKKGDGGGDGQLSALLLDFAEPAICGANQTTTAEEFKQTLEFAANIWNVLIIEETRPKSGILADLRKEFKKNNVEQETVDMMDTLIERRREKFSGDLRTFGEIRVQRRDDGNMVVGVDGM
jgi:hypothetical protein